MELPKLTRVYQNHHLDSKRWEPYQPRPGDVIVTTSYKSGTTFAQQILLHLLHGHEDPLPERGTTSPWIDARFFPFPLEDVYATLEAQKGQRFIKSHLPLDGLPYFEEVKYVIVARDARDVFMSMLNHYENYTELAYLALNGGDRVGDPMPVYSGDVPQMWRDWMTRGWFEWESEGYPMWSNLHHTQTYWDYRHLPNFFFLHYSDMLADHAGCVRRLAEFIGHDASEDDIARVVRDTSFANQKKKAAEFDANEPADAPRTFRGGETSFIFKGTNGRWRDVLSEEDLKLYEDARARVLTPDCAAWLENGGQIQR
jgi:aryl sulfotransferase